jgi:hypothetical protein
MLDSELEEFSEGLEDRNLSLKQLEELASLEKRGRDREEYINEIQRHARKIQLGEELDQVTEKIHELNNDLKKVVQDRDETRLDRKPDEVTEKTVKELRKYLSENRVSRGYLEDILESEKQGKDRKTAKTAIQRHIKKSRPRQDIQKLTSNLEATKDMVEQFSEKLDDSTSDYRLSAIKNPIDIDVTHATDTDSSEDTEDLSKLVELSNDVVTLLRNSKNLDDREIIEELANKALLALEAENYDAFKEKIRRIREVSLEQSYGTQEAEPSDKIFEHDRRTELSEDDRSRNEENLSESLDSSKVDEIGQDQERREGTEDTESDHDDKLESQLRNLEESLRGDTYRRDPSSL